MRWRDRTDGRTEQWVSGGEGWIWRPDGSDGVRKDCHRWRSMLSLSWADTMVCHSHLPKHHPALQSSWFRAKAGGQRWRMAHLLDWISLKDFYDPCCFRRPLRHLWSTALGYVETKKFMGISIDLQQPGAVLMSLAKLAPKAMQIPLAWDTFGGHPDNNGHISRAMLMWKVCTVAISYIWLHIYTAVKVSVDVLGPYCH